MLVTGVESYSTLVSNSSQSKGALSRNLVGFQYKSLTRKQSTLQMVDDAVIQGASIAALGLAVGIGLVAFTENIGERSKARGAGLSEDMQTRIAGGLLEDVEISSVSDLSSLTGQLEEALKKTGATEDFEVSEERKRQIEAQADDGW